MTLWVVLLIAAALGAGYWAGWLMGRKPLSDEQIAKYMSRVVNLEEIEEYHRLLRFRLSGNGKSTIRVDSGPNARVMRARPRARFRRSQGGRS